MASNVQRGTLKMDAGDWVRLKRLGGAKYMYSNNSPTSKDVTNPPPRLEPESGRRVYAEFGTSRIRRPASNWVDYKASQIADYVLQTPAGTCGPGQALTATRVCSCDISKSAISHNGLCVACKK